MEKRSYRRYFLEAGLVFRYFNTRRTNAAFNGRMLNYGPGGLRAILHQYLKPGTALMVRTKLPAAGNNSQATREGFRSVSLAQVRWCRPFSSKDGFSYAVGLKYL
jgi:hypothetical protein